MVLLKSQTTHGHTSNWLICVVRVQMVADVEKTKARLQKEGQEHIDSVIKRWALLLLSVITSLRPAFCPPIDTYKNLPHSSVFTLQNLRPASSSTPSHCPPLNLACLCSGWRRSIGRRWRCMRPS